MDTHDAAIEADAELDGEGLRQVQSRRSEDLGKAATVVANAGIDISGSPIGDDGAVEANESSPLLPRQDNGGDEDDAWVDEFAHLPWYKRPSIFWVLGPFFLLACAFGGFITPKLNLILELVCKQYFSERQVWDPNFSAMPVNFNGADNDQCRIPEVQSRVAQFNLWGSLIAGLISAFTAPKLGELSDRFGRKKIIVVTSLGTIAGEIITICAATYPDTFPVNLLLLSYAIDGLTGSFIVAMAISNAYAADCTAPSRRNVAFAYFHGCLFTGVALGPILAGYIVKVTGKIVYVFYILLGVHTFFMTFVMLVVPESLSEKRQMAAREKRKNLVTVMGPDWDWINKLRSLNFLEPLKVLWPTGPGSSPALRRNLVLLAAVDTIVFGVAMGTMSVLVYYVNYMFGWGTYEAGILQSIINSSRVFALLVILPLLTRFVRGKAGTKAKKKSTGCDTFDLNIIRFAVLLDTLGYVGYTLSKTGPMMILSGTVAALGGMASPTLQSSLTAHVPADQTGQILGASGMLHALARVVAPTVFNGIYAVTVYTFPQTVFLCLAATFGLAFIVSWGLKPGVYFDEDKAAEAANDPGAHHVDHDGQERLPIVGSVVAAFAALGAWLGLRSRSNS